MSGEENSDTGKHTINLPRTGLEKIPDSFVWSWKSIKFCYLNDNNISSLPDHLFETLTNLQWLDLRRNNLEELPVRGLPEHQNLEVLLLQSNRIKILPTALALVKNLKGLQLAGNPIENVPFEIIASGLPTLLRFLKKLPLEEKPLLPVSETIISTPSQKYGRRFNNKKLLRNSIGRKNIRKHAQEGLAATLKVCSYTKKDQEPVTKKPGNQFRKGGHASKFCQSICRRNFETYVDKVVSEEEIQLNYLETRERNRLRETLERQSQMLQRIKAEGAVKNWREDAVKCEKKLLDNLQAYPNKSFIDRTPFGVDPDFVRMPTKVPLFRTIKKWEELERQQKKQQNNVSTKVDIGDLERKIEEISLSLQKIDDDLEVKEDFSKRTSDLQDRMIKINKLRKTLKSLYEKNLLVA